MEVAHVSTQVEICDTWWPLQTQAAGPLHAHAAIGGDDEEDDKDVLECDSTSSVTTFSVAGLAVRVPLARVPKGAMAPAVADAAPAVPRATCSSEVTDRFD